MFKNFLKTTIRNLLRNKIFTSINLFGLTIGMTCSILILLWAVEELNYDKFHNDADKINLVLRGNKESHSAVTSMILAPALIKDIPEIQDATLIAQIPESMGVVVKKGNNAFEEDASIAGSNFFKFFTFEFIEGNSSEALSTPNSVVITEDISRKYFGNKKANGQPLIINAFGSEQSITVKGVIKNMPTNSHIQSSIFFTTDWFKSVITRIAGPGFNYWDNQSYQTYIKLKNNVDKEKISSKIKACEINNSKSNDTDNLDYTLLPLTQIHLYGSEISFLNAKLGDIKYVGVFSAIAVIILLIASMNYINLTTALSIRRAKEAGIKKTIGASKGILAGQFFAESFFLVFCALIFSLILVWILLPSFNSLAGMNTSYGNLGVEFFIIILTVLIFTGILSGSYPAFLFSSFFPIQMLKGKFKINHKGFSVRKAQVIVQFALSIIIIICTLIINGQLNLMQNGDLGYSKENILCLKLSGEAANKSDILKNELLKNPYVTNVSRTEPINGKEWGSTNGVYWKGKSKDTKTSFRVFYTDANFAQTVDLKISSGRFFSDLISTDETESFVINEIAAKEMQLENPINQLINVNGKKGKIIGITKDFHFSSFRSAIEPLIITIPQTDQKNLYFRVLALRIKPGSLNKIVANCETIWKNSFASAPFDFYFLDDNLNSQYRSEQKMGFIFNVFSFLAISIACLGLFGLVALSAEQRTKEIGIRKALGAKISNIIIILSKEFLKWIVVSNLIAWPIAYYIMNNWLQGYAYRIEIHLWMFIISGGLALLIALLTVGLQAYKAANVNPVKSLKYE